RCADIALKSRVIYVYAMFVHHWSRHWSSMTPWFLRGIESGYQSGDMLYLAYSAQDCVIWDPKLDLETAEQEHANYLRVVRDCKYRASLDSGTLFLQLQRAMLGRTDGLTSMNDGEFDEQRCVAGMRERRFMTGIANYHIYKTELCFFHGRLDEALRHLREQDRLIASSMSLPQLVRFRIAAFLTLAACLPEMAPAERQATRTRLQADLRRMRKLARHCPENFLHLQQLMEAELTRLDGSADKAWRLYELAMDSAHRHEFRRDEAMANELAGRHLLAAGRPKPAVGYLRAAHQIYAHWGAHRKEVLLEQEFPQILRPPARSADPRETAVDSEALDIASVMKASRAISSEIVLEQLWTTTMRIMLENAGGQRGCFVIRRDGQLTVEGLSEIGSENGGTADQIPLARRNHAVDIMNPLPLGEGRVRDEAPCRVGRLHLPTAAVDKPEAPCPPSDPVPGNGRAEIGNQRILQESPSQAGAGQPEEIAALLPVSIVHHVLYGNAPVVYNTPAQGGPFARDPYFAEHRPQSLLCVPLIRQGKSEGVIYMENSLASGAFTEDRIEIIKLLAAQVTISAENARLYDDQRRLIEAQRRFVPGQFLESLEHPDIAGVDLGQHVAKRMSVLFADLRGFTPLAERLDPRTVIALLNRYFVSMEPAISQAGGFIDSFAGDGIKALFDASADSALRGAVAMWRALEEFNRVSAEMGQPELNMGVGINTGPVVLGTVGSHNRIQCSVIGDTVNLASRIEQLTKVYRARLLIGEHSYRSLNDPGTFAIRMVDRVSVKGKNLAAELYEVLDAEPPERRAAKLATRQRLHAAIDLFYARDFSGARAAFEAVATTDPADVVPALFIDRCERYQHTPPPADWQGFERLGQK
ncbi:MAG: GAF domain-containing protein, partial [Methylococcaceae bacterium]|nr:GAF domain-containing protein [Methylococcaceae bacterium]